jgi:predicted dehydrogenase
MAAIRWGIIGCGDVTEVKSGPAFNLVEDSALVAVMRRDAAKAADYARRHHVPRWYSDAEALLNDPEINAVYIATPPAFHKEYTLRALQKGLHVYLEKPVTLNAAEAREIVQAAASSSAKVSVAHYRRGLPAFRLVKELIAQGKIGEVRVVQLQLWQPSAPDLVAKVSENWRVQPHLSGGGYFHDLAPHQLDLMLYFFGNPAHSQGISLNQAGLYPADDLVCGQALFNNTIAFSGTWCFSATERETIDQCTIIGNTGSIRFSFFGPDATISVFSEAEGNQEHYFGHPPHIQQPMIADVVDYFRGKGPNPCSAGEALTVMQLMDAFTAARSLAGTA